ncbi:hypothetical protein TraAM80_10314, partial [Trypanosoma rangeli]
MLLGTQRRGSPHAARGRCRLSGGPPTATFGIFYPPIAWGWLPGVETITAATARLGKTQAMPTTRWKRKCETLCFLQRAFVEFKPLCEAAAPSNLTWLEGFQIFTASAIAGTSVGI